MDKSKNGVGNGSVSYRVGINDSPDERVGTIQLGDAILTVTQGGAAWTYETWRTVHLPEGGPNGPNDDFSGDGVSNYANYALGFDPRQDNSQLLLPPQLEDDDSGNRTFTFYSIRSKTAPDLHFALRSTSDMRNWTDPGLEPELYSQYPNSDIYKVSVPITSENRSQFFTELIETIP